MRTCLVLIVLIGAATAASAQDNHWPARPSVPTLANFGLRAADTAQTCTLFAVHSTAREMAWPGVGRSCARLTAVNLGVASAAWAGDRWLARRGHPRLGKALQWISAGGAVQGMVYTTRHWEPRR